MTARTGGTLRFEGVTKHFQRPGRSDEVTVAADDVHLSIGPDESVAIIGPNGAGKSSLLRLAAGVSAPTVGRIVRTGRTCAVIELGVGLHPDLTGRENIELNGILLGMAAGELRSRFDEIVEFAELGDVLDQPTRMYSTGMLARLSFSVAAHSDPDLLLLDEVLSVGDLSFQRRCRSLISELRAQGTTILIVSHDLGLVDEVCERTIVLIEGRVDFDGPTAASIRRYVGLPEPAGSPEGLRFDVERTSIPAGSPITATITYPAALGPDRLRLELIIRNHPTFLRMGEQLSIVFGAVETTPTPPEPSVVRIPTAGLPAGSFELRCSLEDPNGATLASSSVPISLTGATGPFAIGLAATARFDALPDAPEGTIR